MKVNQRGTPPRPVARGARGHIRYKKERMKKFKKENEKRKQERKRDKIGKKSNFCLKYYISRKCFSLNLKMSAF